MWKSEKQLTASGSGWKDALFSLGCALVFITLFSQNSFLYVFNDWVDVNTIFSAGRGMHQGLVLYQGCIDHKGPLIYFAHQAAAAISETSFIGVYLLEVVCVALFLFGACKVLMLWLRRETSWLLLPVLAFLTTTGRAFQKGDSAEELCLPLLILGLWAMLRHDRDGKPFTQWQLALYGAAAGAVFWVKFTMVGLWFAWMAVIFFELVAHKEWKLGLRSCVSFLLGMAATALPWLVYFGWHHALKDFFDVYFYSNLFQYPLNEDLVIKGHAFTGLAAKVLGPLYVIYRSAAENWAITLVVGLGVLALLFTRLLEDRWGPRLRVLALIAGTLAFQYAGRRAYSYYYLLMAVFLPLGLAVLGLGLEKLRRRQDGRIALGWAFASLALFAALGVPVSPNIPQMKKTKMDYPQYRMTEQLRDTGRRDDFLVYGIYDYGFYMAAEKDLICPAYAVVNANSAHMFDLQRQCLEERDIPYVLTSQRIWDQEGEKYLSDYEIVARDTGEGAGYEDFLLLEKKQ